MKTRFLLLLATVAILGLVNSETAQESKFDRMHPRRAEMNSRLKNQNSLLAIKQIKVK